MSETKDWRKICADCQEGEPPKDCEYYGEPNGCNSPTYGEHPPVGNGAKMREALEGAKRTLQYLYKPELSPCDGDNRRITEAVGIINAALEAKGGAE